ncbi:MAG TPA: holo-ACP synthase [Bacillales bacterium]|nr:holo-ACP synthase [Bacillales bacterium]
MIAGIGIDLVEISRVQKALRRQKRFPERILTEREREKYEDLQPPRQVEFLAGRFAAKEAYAKAAGTGIGAHVSWQDIEVIADENGRPLMKVKGSDVRIHVAVTHTEHYAAAQVVIENP